MRKTTLTETVPSLTPIHTPISAPSQMPHEKMSKKTTQSPSNKLSWLSKHLPCANTSRNLHRYLIQCPLCYKY